MYYDDVQIRLLILYTLKAFKISMTVEHLQEVLVWSGLLDYFTMMDFLLDMKGLGIIETIDIEGESRYNITDKGEELVRVLKEEIPINVRIIISDKAEQALNKIERGREIVADIVPVDMRKYLAKCGIYERGTPLLEVNIFAGSRKNAEEIASRFKKDAGEIYKIILERIVE
jgi:DNA-binding PadR family transcriptional regulator